MDRFNVYVPLPKGTVVKRCTVRSDDQELTIVFEDGGVLTVTPGAEEVLRIEYTEPAVRWMNY